MLLLGVAIFTIVMGNFAEILEKFNEMNADLDDYDRLSSFLGVMKVFNRGRPIKPQFKDRIEKFFSCKWLNDRNQAIDDEDEKQMLEELPTETQDKLYAGFLFQEFLKTFRQFFLIEKNKDENN